MEIINRLLSMSQSNEKSTLEILAKLFEEGGEVSSEYLAYAKASGSSYKEGTPEKVRAECIDSIMVAFSLFVRLGGDIEMFKDILSSKLDKWEAVTKIK